VEHGVIKSKGNPSLLDAGLGTALISGGLMGGYSLVNHFIKERRRKAMQEQLDQSKGEYSRLLGQTLSKNAGLDSVVEFPFIHGICAGIVEGSGFEKAASDDKDSVIMSGDVISGVDKNPHIEKDPVHGWSVGGPSTTAGAKSAQVWSKAEAEKHLGRKLENNKTATTSSGMLLAGSPGILAVLSGIAAHRWMYNRQNELEKLYTSKKPEPPKQIRLVSVPAPGSEQDDDQPLQLGAPEPEKVAGLAEILDFVKSPEAVEIEKEKENLLQPRATKVAPGTVQVSTPGGSSTEIEATDPATARILAHNTSRLTKLLAAYQSTPMMAA
jgi:hypothetical protein